MRLPVVKAASLFISHWASSVNEKVALKGCKMHKQQQEKKRTDGNDADVASTSDHRLTPRRVRIVISAVRYYY